MKDKAQFLIMLSAVFYIICTTDNVWVQSITFIVTLTYLLISDKLIEEKWERKIEKVRRSKRCQESKS